MSGPCSIELLESALAGRLPFDKEAALHRHLEECAACSAAIEQLAGGPTWCREAAALLSEDELDAAVPMREEWSDVDFTVEHLDPADQPNLLGRLGGYDVLEIIGRGGMGIVLKGFDRELKRCVAIKVLAPHLAQSSLARKRFAREAQAAAAVVHPHVLAIHQVQATGRLPFLVMPLVAGESLAQRIAAQGTLELREILRIGMQAAAGLSAAHEQGLVHRDVKPANILLERGVERAVLTDFGLARAADDVTLTRWGVIAGTPQYMSPEQARGEPLDARSDLFSLGCVLYEMATGVSPFRTDSVMATMRRLIDDAPQSIAALNPDLPAWFIAIVDRLLEKDPARRFGSAKEVSGLLEACLAHVQQPAGVPLPTAAIELIAPQASQSLVEQIPGPASRGRGRRFVGRIALAIVFGAALLGIFLKQATEPPDIAGPWSGDEWGDVVLTKTNDGGYTGTYSETLGKGPGEIQLRWSRIERRFNGSWREGEDRFGELSVRLVDTEIRGALTTDVKSKINPATPRLADLTWTKSANFAASRSPFPIVTHISRNHQSVLIVHDNVDLHYVFYYAGDFDASSTGSHDERSGVWQDKGRIKLRNGRVFDYHRESTASSHVHINDYEGTLSLGNVIQLRDDGTPLQTGFSIPLRIAFDPPALAKLVANPGLGQLAMRDANLSYGPVIEREVKNDEAIDFDSGAQATMPEFEAANKGLGGIGERAAAGATWMDQQGMDALFDGSSLNAFGMKVRALRNADWDEMTPSELGMVIGCIDSKARPQVLLAPGKASPATYAFQTREGGRGMLQVLAIASDGVKFRYKLILSGDAKTAGRTPVRTLKRDIQIRFVSIPDEEHFRLPKADSVEHDWAAIQANPQAIVFAAPKFITMSGQECELEVGTDAAADARARPTINVRLRSTFEGQTVHYTARLSIISQQTTDDGVRTTTHELIHSGDAALDQPQMVEIGRGADQRRYLAWILFGQGEMSLPAVQASSSATFGPVIERVLPQGEPCREQYFQFRSGQIFIVGNGPGTSKEEAAYDEQRIEEAGGADMSAASGADGVVFYGRGCFFTRDIGGLEWDGLTAEQVVERLKHATHVEGEARVMKKDLPFSYLFKTARGEMGVMEVLGVVDEKREGWTERGMKFRYKLVQGAGTKNIAKPPLNFGEATQGLQAALEVAAGEPFRLRIHIRNVSDHGISIHGTHYRQEDECLLADADGKPVPVTKVTHDIKIGMKGGYFAPGQVAVFECAGLSFQSIDKAPPSAGYVAQAKPGRYTLRVRLRLPGDDVRFAAGENAWKGELQTGPVIIEVKDPATRTVAPVADAVLSSHLGQPVEITVSDLQTTRENCALSLDTGKLMSVPASITLDTLSENKLTKAPAQPEAEAGVRAQEESLTWARNNQVDAVAFVTTKDGKVVKCGLLCPDVLVFHVENKAWTPDLADPQMLKEHFEKAMREWNFIPRIAEIASDGDFPATYLILDTRTHRRGVLQILGASSQPRGVKISYRLIEGAAVKRITPAEQSDARRPAGARLSVTKEQVTKFDAMLSAAPTPAVAADPLSVIELKVAEQQLEKTLTDLQAARAELALLPSKPGLSEVAREAEVRKLDIKVRILEQQADRLREVIQHLASGSR